MFVCFCAYVFFVFVFVCLCFFCVCVFVFVLLCVCVCVFVNLRVRVFAFLRGYFFARLCFCGFLLVFWSFCFCVFAPGNPADLPCRIYNEGPTWRIIPVSKWLVTMVSKSPKWGYSPYKLPKWLINGGY